MKLIKENLVASIIVAVLALAAAVCFCPLIPLGWGLTFITIIIALCLLVYLFVYLFPHVIVRQKKVNLALSIIEFSVLIIIAILLILENFIPALANIVPSEVCVIIGIVLWLRGSIDILRSYNDGVSGNKTKYSFWIVILDVILVSIGCWFFFVSPVTNSIFVWIIFILFAVAFVLLLVNVIKLIADKKKKA